MRAVKNLEASSTSPWALVIGRRVFTSQVTRRGSSSSSMRSSESAWDTAVWRGVVALAKLGRNRVEMNGEKEVCSRFFCLRNDRADAVRPCGHLCLW